MASDVHLVMGLSRADEPASLAHDRVHISRGATLRRAPVAGRGHPQVVESLHETLESREAAAKMAGRAVEAASR